MAALPDAWIYYRSPKLHSRPAFAAEYQLQCHLDSPITFLGVWDTVGSLGIPGSLLAAGNKEKFAFHDTNPSPLVMRAVQALAIDEHRHDFTPTFWTGPIPPNARPRPPADAENDPNMLNSKSTRAEDLTIMRPPNTIKPEKRGRPRAEAP